MCMDIDHFSRIAMLAEKDAILSNDGDRRNNSTSSVTLSALSTATSPKSWIGTKLFTYLKRLFRRNPFCLEKNSSPCSRRPSSVIEQVITKPFDEQLEQKNDGEEEQQRQKENSDHTSDPTSSSLKSSFSSLVNKQEVLTTNKLNSTDLLYDYNRLLARCVELQRRDRSEMILRCETPITIPRADLAVNRSSSELLNWKSYISLFETLKRDPQLFRQYIDQVYACQSSINHRGQLTFNVRMTRTTLDNLLKKFLNEYVTCLICQKAQTHLIKSIDMWRIECQLCGSQRSVERLKWKIVRKPKN